MLNPNQYTLANQKLWNGYYALWNRHGKAGQIEDSKGKLVTRDRRVEPERHLSYFQLRWMKPIIP